MSGFVGTRSRKRRRNIFISLIIIALITVIVLIFPSLENQNIEIIPNDGSASIKFFFIDKSLNLIRYKDSIGIEHGIELSPI